MRLKVLVVDDEPLARDGLKLLVGRQPQVESVTEARNGREAVALIRERKPDLVLLDVQMPRMDGFAVVQAVGAENMPTLIFVTAHDQYAIRAFEIAAVDYLLKPVSEERFSMAFERASARLQRAPHEEGTRQVLAMLEAIANPARQVVDRGDLECANRVLIVGGHEDERRHVLRADRLHDPEAVHAGHLDVEQHQVRFLVANQRDRLAAVARLGHGLDLRLTAEQQLQPVARERLVVDHHGADHDGASPRVAGPAQSGDDRASGLTREPGSAAGCSTNGISSVATVPVGSAGSRTNRWLSP